MKGIKIEGHSNLIRDVDSGGIINTNKMEYENYLIAKKNKKNEEFKVEKLEKEIFSMKDDINEIKNLLRKLANGS